MEGDNCCFSPQLLCVIVSNKEDMAAFANFTGDVVAPPAAAATPISTSATPPSVRPPAGSASQAPPPLAKSAGGMVFASPFAKTLAKEKGIDLSVSKTIVLDSVGLTALIEISF